MATFPPSKKKTRGWRWRSRSRLWDKIRHAPDRCPQTCKGVSFSCSPFIPFPDHLLYGVAVRICRLSREYSWARFLANAILLSPSVSAPSRSWTSALCNSVACNQPWVSVSRCLIFKLYCRRRTFWAPQFLGFHPLTVVLADTGTTWQAALRARPWNRKGPYMRAQVQLRRHSGKCG